MLLCLRIKLILNLLYSLIYKKFYLLEHVYKYRNNMLV